MNERESRSPNSSQKISHAHGYSVSATWKEAKESSVKSFTKRSIPLACSSVIKAKMTSWVPSSGIRVNVDLASLRSQRKKKNTMPLSRSFLIPMITGSHCFLHSASDTLSTQVSHCTILYCRVLLQRLQKKKYPQNNLSRFQHATPLQTTCC